MILNINTCNDVKMKSAPFIFITTLIMNWAMDVVLNTGISDIT